MPRINQVPSCCGAAIIHDLNTQFLNDRLNSIAYVTKKMGDTRFTQFTIILSDQQRDKIGPDLEKLGFVRVSEMRNHNSNNLIHTYMYSRVTHRNTEPKIASVDKAYPPVKVVEKEVKVYELTPEQKAMLKRVFLCLNKR